MHLFGNSTGHTKETCRLLVLKTFKAHLFAESFSSIYLMLVVSKHNIVPTGTAACCMRLWIPLPLSFARSVLFILISPKASFYAVCD